MQGKKLLIIGKVWPEPKSSAAGWRMMQLIHTFLNAGSEVHFASTASATGFETKLDGTGVKTHTIQLNDDNFDAFILALRPDVVMYDRFMTEEQFGWRVRNVLPNTMTVLDTEDFHFLRKGRQDGVKQRGYFKSSDFYNDTTKRELASILRTDLTLIISSFEMDLLEKQFKMDSSKLFYLPLIMEKADNIVPFDERTDLVFIGNFMHEPNWDAVLQLKKIWKQWEHKPKQLRLKVYGAYPPQKAFQLNSDREQFHIMGRADDAEAVIGGARLLLAPLRFGAGLKGKLIEAMRLGTPSVTTSVGVEGIADKTNWGGVVEDDFEQWPRLISNLFDDEEQWNSFQQRGFENLTRLCDSSLLDELLSKIAQLSERLAEHRQNNYLGEVLHHQTLRSTEYMSRWIAEKNK